MPLLIACINVRVVGVDQTATCMDTYACLLLRVSAPTVNFGCQGWFAVPYALNSWLGQPQRLATVLHVLQSVEQAGLLDVDYLTAALGVIPDETFLEASDETADSGEVFAANNAVLARAAISAAVGALLAALSSYSAATAATTTEMWRAWYCASVVTVNALRGAGDDVDAFAVDCRQQWRVLDALLPLIDELLASPSAPGTSGLPCVMTFCCACCSQRSSCVCYCSRWARRCRGRSCRTAHDQA